MVLPAAWRVSVETGSAVAHPAFRRHLGTARVLRGFSGHTAQQKDSSLTRPGLLTFSLMTSPWSAFPVQFPQPSISGLSQITKSLFISNGVAANNKLLLTSNQITTVINVSVEVANTFYEDIQYVQVPVVDAPIARLSDFFDPIADHIHSVEMKQGRTLLHCAAGVSRSAALCLAYLMKYHAMSLLDAHNWTKSRRPIIRPNSGFWEQLIHYEFQLFGKNTMQMINSPVGLIPDIYEKETRLMIPL